MPRRSASRRGVWSWVFSQSRSAGNSGARVTLFTAAVRRRYGGMQHSMPSGFLDEIDPDLLERRAILPEGRPARSNAGRGQEWRGRSVRTSYGSEEVDDHPRYEEETQDAALAAGMRALRK